MKTSEYVRMVVNVRLVAGLAALFVAGTFLLCGCTTEVTRADKSLAPDDFEQSADRPPTSRTLYTMARILIGQNRDGEAEYILVRIIKQDAGYVPAYCALADMQLRSKKVDEAEKTLLAGLSNAPNDAVLLNNLGMCKVARADYEGSLVFFNRASDSDPRTRRYTANRAMALGMLGRYDESLEAYYRIVSPPEFTPADAHFNVAVLSDARGDAERAKSEFALADQLREQQKKEFGKSKNKESKPMMPAPSKPVGQASANAESGAEKEPKKE